MSTQTITIITSLLLAVNGVLPAHADTYFTSEADPFLGPVVPTRPAIHADLEKALHNSRRGDVEARLALLEAQLFPTFQVLPKNAHGRLESPVVRYLLHRHFLRNRAWLVNGLAPDGAGWNSSSPDMILEGHVSKQVHELIRDHLYERGLNLHETAVLAALLENEIHQDAVDRLHGIWEYHVSEAPHTAVSMKRMEVALSMYMLTYIPGVDTTGKPAEESIRDGIELYPSFNRTQSFVRDLIRKNLPGQHEKFHLADAERMVVGITENYGRWQEQECKDLKRDVLALKQGRPGYADLRAFYNKALVDEFWQFSESIPYLRSLGALHESNPEGPAIIIANYMNSPSQYIGASHFYSVSCLDECEPILAGIENAVGAPYASITQIWDAVRTDTMWHMPPSAAFVRLQEIKELHEGKIPLHGRLFQQWLHHMYPFECAYPHVTGTTRVETPEDFENRTNISSVETDEEMKNLTKGWNGRTKYLADIDGRLWDAQEELLSSPQKASMDVMDLLLTTKIPFHLGGLAGLVWMILALVAKTAFHGALQGPASAALLLPVEA